MSRFPFHHELRVPGGGLRVVTPERPPLERLGGPPAALQLAFRPIADLHRGDAFSFEGVLGVDDEPARSAAEWSARGTERHAGAIEARVVELALAARPALPGCSVLMLTVTAAGALTAPLQDVLAAAAPLDDVLLSVADVEEVDTFALAAALEAAREDGARIALDAGTAGQPDLERLVQLRPDVVRAGQALVDGVADAPARAAAVIATVALAARIDAEVLAADVARETDLRALRPLGVAFAMGSVVGEPRAEMRAPGTAVEALLAAMASGDAGELAVARLVESPIALPVDTPLSDLVDTLLIDPRNDHLVLVDGDHRPVALVERAAVLRAEPYERSVMWVLPDSPVRAVARRAMERPPLERFTPLVCCDAAARYIGLIRIERLVGALAG